MNKHALTLVLLLGVMGFAKAQSIPTNSGGTVSITNMGGFNGTYAYQGSVPSGTNYATYAGYPIGTMLHRFDYPDGTGRVVMVILSGETTPRMVRIYRNSGMDNATFDINGNVVTNTNSSLSVLGGGYNLLNNTFPDYMATWPEGGTGPGYVALLSQAALNEAARLKALEKAKDLTEGLTFENGQWSPE
jgi:hypothetical protein